MENKDRKSMSGVLLTWGQVKDVVYPALAPRSWAKLEGVQPVARDFLDLSVYYYMRLEEAGSFSCFWITKGVLHKWGISVGELDSQASANMEADRYTAIDIRDVLGIDGMGSFLYALMNRDSHYGAAGMLNTAMLREMAGAWGSDLYILPSSVHEVLLLPADKCECPGKLDSLVTEINQMMVPANKRLADHAYCYMQDTGEVCRLTEIGG